MNDPLSSFRSSRLGRGLVAAGGACALLVGGAIGGYVIGGADHGNVSVWQGADAQGQPSALDDPAAALKEQLLGLMPWISSDDSNSDSPRGSGSSTQDVSESLDIAAASTSESTGIVVIETELGYQSAASAGTGIVLTADGTILTNNHVVSGATNITVTTADGTQYEAGVVGTDSTEDVAVLQLEDASGLATATIDDDGDPALGDNVTAVGNANGGGVLMATSGPVTAIDTEVTASSATTAGGSETLDNMIEFDADVVSGDSGGAVLDDEGEVVGVTTIASTGGSNISGYAIDIDTALDVAQHLIDGVATDTNTIGTPAFLGIAIADSTTPGSQAASGAVVGGVYEDTPAADLGLSEGDTITAVEGIAVGSASELSGLIAEYTPGTEVTITWTTSSGAEQSGTTTLIAGPAD